MSNPLLALTIHQPWVWAIFHAGKDVENRSWHTPFRGRIAVHASKTIDQDQFAMFDEVVFEHDIAIPGGVLPNSEAITTGAIIGTVEIVACVSKSDSPWFFGPFGFALREPRLLKTPIPTRGYQKFWQVPADIAQQIRAEIGG